MNVSQLRCACIDPEWRESWKAGGNPSPFDFPKHAHATVYGLKFHALAQRFTAQLRSERKADTENHDALLGRLYALGASDLLEQLLQEGKVESAGALTTAFHALCTRMLQLRGANGGRRFDQIFIAEEYALSDVALETSAGKLFVSGTIDSVRIDGAGKLLVVDYKLSTGEHLDKELVQIALYRTLLRTEDPALQVSCVLEYFLPHLHVTPLAEAELERVYQDAVAPILAELVSARRQPGNDVTRGQAAEAEPQPKRPAAVDKPRATKADAGLRRLEGSASQGARPNKLAGVVQPLKVPPTESNAVSNTAQPSAVSLRLGTSYGYTPGPVEVEMNTLLRHCAVLGGSGSGKTTLALRIIEQTVGSGIPALLVDRKGDLARYADPAAAESQSDPELARALQWLQSTLDIALFTPGHAGGRPLRFNLVPPLAELAVEDQQAQLRVGAQTLGHMLKLKHSAADDAKRALLLCALEFHCKHHGSVSITGLVALLESGDPSFAERAGILSKEASKLLVQLKSFEVMNQELLSEHGEPLDTEYLLGLGSHSKPNKTRLAIVSTRFFDSEETTLSWVAQMISELNRYAARKPAASLQALVMFDEADLYLPAVRQPATKAPLESLLKRARSAGLGVMLATQSPGDLDYRCRENVLTWLVGRVKEPTALEKLKPLAAAVGVDPHAAFPKQKVGQFHVIGENTARAFQADRSWLTTEQISERDILAFAKATRR